MQVTQQLKDLDQARKIYDALMPLTPLLVRIKLPLVSNLLHQSRWPCQRLALLGAGTFVIPIAVGTLRQTA